MKKTALLSFLLLLFWGLCGNAQAQWRYVVDNLHADSTKVYSRVKNDGKDSKKVPYQLGDVAFMMANGDTLTIAAADSGRTHLAEIIREGKTRGKWFATVTVKGKKYFVANENLKFADGSKDWINEKGDHHTPLGHWYSSATPYWLIVAFVVLAFLCALFGARAESGVLVWLTVPFLALAVGLECLGIYALGTDVLWWMDMKVYGFGPAFWGCLLMFVVTILQFVSMLVMAGSSEESGLSFLAPLIATVVGFIAAVICIFIGGVSKGDGSTMVNIGFIIFAVAVVLSLVFTFINNIAVLKPIGGILFSLFILVWTIGVLAMVVLFIIGLISFFAESIMMVAGFVIAFILSKRFFPIYEFIDSSGTLVRVFEK